ncbi:MAG: tRNA epoxyqueuosine(34) reductase QueG [Prevotellaceae bacterium]|jgi:epoxyqueuosine reductase|nr:tRNA epoxyqueuosine(34) reductase QueG [Prevotellaceae bacterium]
MIGLSEISNIVKNQAAQVGFDACGIAKADYLSDKKNVLQKWLDKGYNASMNYMQNHFEMRLNPQLLVENAKSVICLLISYNSNFIQIQNAPKIARYAFGNDYHNIIRKKLNSLLVSLNQIFPEINGRGFVDSAPVFEREWAVRAGLGWYGKSSVFISPVLGSFVFLSELIVDIEMEYDKPLVGNFCGACNKCIANCPNSAITEPYVVNSQKCISYQTIENKNEINISTHGWLFGCDRCLQVCPYNKRAKICNHKEFQPIDEILNMSFDDWENIDEDNFKITFKNSPLMRTGYEGIKRNLKNITQQKYKSQ